MTLVSIDPPAGVTCDTTALPKITCTVPAAMLEVADPAVQIGISVTVPDGSGTVTNKSIVTSPDDPAPCVVTSNDITCTEPTDNFSEVPTTVPAVVAAAEVTAPTPGAQVAAAEALAFTGSSGTTPLARLAGLLVLVGAAALVIASRTPRGSSIE